MIYDLAILNATVVDGTGAPPRVADLGIVGDRVATIGRVTGSAREVLDAYGRIVTPGFIDLHARSDFAVHADPLAASKLHQGVTTEVNGNCGDHAAPLAGELAAQRRDHYRTTLGVDVTWTTTAEHRAVLVDAAPALNYAQLIGFNTAVAAIAGPAAAPLSPRDRERVRDLVRAELAAGAIGVSFNLGDAAARFVTTPELVDIARECAAAGAPVSFHLRDEDAGVIAATEEALDIAAQANAACHVAHLKTFGRANWPKLDAVLERLTAARAAGMPVTVGRYPHVAMTAPLAFMLPAWCLADGIAEAVIRLRTPSVRAQIIAELEHGGARAEASAVLLALLSDPRHKHLEGQYLDQAAAAGSPYALACDLLAADGEAAVATLFGMSSANLDRILALPYAVVGSDAAIQPIHRLASAGRPHPRAFDTFPFFIAEWVYARRQLTLAEAVAKITSMPAQIARLRDRGTLGEGSFADIVVLDPELLDARTRYDQPIRYPAAVTHVVVNGEPVIVDGVHTGTRPGRYLIAEAAR